MIMPTNENAKNKKNNNNDNKNDEENENEIMILIMIMNQYIDKHIENRNGNDYIVFPIWY